MIVVRDRYPTWAVFFAILLLLVAVAIIMFVITGGRGTVFVVAIPGFPVESILIGLVVGLFWVILRRKKIMNWGVIVQTRGYHIPCNGNPGEV